MTGSWRPIDILLAGTGAGVAVCAFLPWAQISAGFLSVTKTGYDGDGQFTLILGLLVILAVVVFVYGKLAEWAMLLAALICGGFIAGIGMIDWIDLESRRSDLGDAASIVDVSVGIGLVLTVVGGFVIAIASGLRLYPHFEHWRDNRSKQRGHGPDDEPPLG